MAYCVVQVRTTAFGAPTVCAVQGEAVLLDFGMLRVQRDGQTAYSAPLSQVVAHAMVADQPTAMATMRDWQQALVGKGRLGDEHAGMRPAAGAPHQVGHVVEAVRVATEGQTAKPSAR